MDVNIQFMSSQLIHLEIKPVIGESLCFFVYGDSGATDKCSILHLLRLLCCASRSLISILRLNVTYVF